MGEGTDGGGGALAPAVLAGSALPSTIRGVHAPSAVSPADVHQRPGDCHVHDGYRDGAVAAAAADCRPAARRSSGAHQAAARPDGRRKRPSVYPVGPATLVQRADGRTVKRGPDAQSRRAAFRARAGEGRGGAALLRRTMAEQGDRTQGCSRSRRRVCCRGTSPTLDDADRPRLLDFGRTALEYCCPNTTRLHALRGPRCWCSSPRRSRRKSRESVFEACNALVSLGACTDAILR